MLMPTQPLACACAGWATPSKAASHLCAVESLRTHLESWTTTQSAHDSPELGAISNHVCLFLICSFVKFVLPMNIEIRSMIDHSGHLPLAGLARLSTSVLALTWLIVSSRRPIGMSMCH